MMFHRMMNYDVIFLFTEVKGRSKVAQKGKAPMRPPLLNSEEPLPGPSGTSDELDVENHGK